MENRSGRLRLWTRIGACAVASFFSSGVLVAFPTVEPILLDRRPTHGAGLFAHLCANSSSNASFANSSSSIDVIDACEAQENAAATLYSVALAAMQVVSLPGGYLFDYAGPRASSVIAALTTGASLAMLSLGLMYPRFEWLVWLGVPLAEGAGQITAMSIYGFIWHAPQHVALVVSVIALSNGISTYMAALAVWLVRGPAIVPPTLVWFLPALLTLPAAAILACAAPSRREFHAAASTVLGRPSSSVSGSLLHAIAVVAKWWRRDAANWSFLGFSLLIMATTSCWGALYVQLQQSSLGAADAATAVGAFALFAGPLAALAQPILSGCVYDCIGLRAYLAAVTVGLLAFIATLLLPGLAWQLVGLGIGVLATFS